MACPIIRTLNTWREIIQFSALIQTSALCKFTLDDCRERLLDLLLLLAGLGGFAAFLALLDGSYAQAAASAIVALLLCPFAVPMLLSLAGSALIVAASAIFAWLFWKQNMTMNRCWTAPHLLDSMIYYLTDGVIYYVKRKTEQTIYAGIQENGCRNHGKRTSEYLCNDAGIRN